ncbi:MAG: ABC transporter ATP-binding protein [Candidatus Hodarchaeales archaeon]
MGVNLLSVTRLKKDYITGEITVPALKGIDLSVDKGKFIVIFGPSGCGKTTLLNLIGGIDQATSGVITVNTRDITNLSEKKLTDYRKDDIGFIFQFYNLIPTLTAIENVELAARLQFPEDAYERSLDFLRQVGMEDKVHKYPSQLSGGEQQRVAIARALVKEPLLVLADEPTGNLDMKTGEIIIKLMLEICHDKNTTFLIVTHDSAIATLADEIIYLQDGLIVDRKSIKQ